MKVSGQATLHGPVERVYAALNDPAVLVRTIPGCQRLEQVDADAYRMVVTAGVASVKGTYSGDIRLTEQRAPHSFVLKASGSGGPGTVSADVTVSLRAGGDGTTVLSYDADAVVGGVIAGVGQRVLSGVAKKTAGEFFAAVDGLLGGAEAAARAPAAIERAAVGRAAVEPAAPAAGGPAVFTRPAEVSGPRIPDFAAGVLAGAAAALLGVLVGGYVATRAARRARSG